MLDFSIYKALKLSEIQSNTQFTSANGGINTTGASNVIAQTCWRQQAFKVANLTAATSETAQGEARVQPTIAFLKSANLISAGGNAASSTAAFNVVSLWKRANLGSAAPVLMASANLSGVVITQYVPVPFTLAANSANYTLAVGDVVTANIAITSTGVANNLPCEIDFMTEDY